MPYQSDAERGDDERDEIIEWSVNSLKPQKFIKRHTISGAKYFQIEDSDSEGSESDDDVEGGGAEDGCTTCGDAEGRCTTCDDDSEDEDVVVIKPKR